MRKHLILTSTRVTFLAILIILVLSVSSMTAFAESTPQASHGKLYISYMHLVQSHSGVTPKGTTPGNCGEIGFYMSNAGGGNASFLMFVSSSVGPISSLTYSWSWFNYSQSEGQGYGDTIAVDSDLWTIDPDIHTETGFVAGSISATDVTPKGQCVGSQGDNDIIT